MAGLPPVRRGRAGLGAAGVVAVGVAADQVGRGGYAVQPEAGPRRIRGYLYGGRLAVPTVKPPGKYKKPLF